MIKNPNFFCIGTQKAGTTTLYNLLIQHPQIYLPINKKELHFFDVEENYSKGIQWYLNNYFSKIKNETAIGEVTPAYCYYPQTPKRIFEEFGSDIKFIFILRNPVQRALSLYNMMVSRGVERLSFHEAVEEESSRLETDNPSFKRNFSYIDRGYYSKQLLSYLEYFDEKNILLISFENELMKDMKGTINKIESFLKVDHYNTFNFEVSSNPSNLKHKNKYISTVKTKLNFFSPFINPKLKKIVNNLFFKKVKFKTTKLDEKEQRFYLEKYYMDEVHNINKLTNNKFAYWLN